MAFKKGHKKMGGKQKGTPNKVSAEIKDMIRNALDNVGGEAYLMQQAQDNPASFMALIGKIIPADVRTTLTGKNGGPIETRALPATDSWIEGLLGSGAETSSKDARTH